MGIDYTLTVGIGVHIEKDLIKKYMDENDFDDEYERMYDIADEFDLEVQWAGDAWSGRDYGFVFYVPSTYNSLDGDDSGVFRPQNKAITLENRHALEAAASKFTNDAVPIEALLVRTIS